MNERKERVLKALAFPLSWPYYVQRPLKRNEDYSHSTVEGCVGASFIGLIEGALTGYILSGGSSIGTAIGGTVFSYLALRPLFYKSDNKSEEEVVE